MSYIRMTALAAVAALAMMPQAHAGALVANCTLKPDALIKTMPVPGDQHVLSGPMKEQAVAVYDEHGGQWAYIESDEISGGWVPRSSLLKCENIKPWKK